MPPTCATFGVAALKGSSRLVTNSGNREFSDEKPASLLQRVKAQFSSQSLNLAQSRELLFVFVLKVFASYEFFSLSRIMALYLSEEFGLTDVQSGTAYGLWGSLLTVYGLFLGGAIDALGIKISLAICFFVSFFSRLVMACTTTPWLMLFMTLGPNAIAGALGVPVLTIAVKRFTTEHNRGFAFSVFYSLMNVAALLQGLLLDLFRITFKDGFNVSFFTSHSVLNNGTRLFVLTGCLTSAIGLVITLAIKEPAIHKHGNGSSGALEGGVEERAETAALMGDSRPSGSREQRQKQPKLTLGQRMAEFARSVKEIYVSRGFVKFLFFCFFTVNLKSLFRHLDATLPKFQLRAYGCNTPIGAIYSINPAMIIGLVPIVGALTTRLAHFDMIHYGGWVSAVSPLWIVAVPSLWATAAFVATLSLGEAVWSPRWYDYSMSVAPDGKEGLFTALTSAPLFLAMLPTGMISGALLQQYCPAAEGQECAKVEYCDGRSLWGWVAGISISSPLLIMLTQQWVRPAAGDFPTLDLERVDAVERVREPEVDVNEAGPTAVLEHVSQARRSSRDR